MKNLNACLAILTLTLAGTAGAWGERGHHTICEVATRLVEQRALKSFLLSRGHQMGHICNIPDINWRSLGEAAKAGDAAHFMNPENLKYVISDVPTDFEQIVKTSGKTGKQVAEELGSLWWRADQFARASTNQAKAAKIAVLPTYEQSQDAKQPYNSAVYGMVVAMGLMGHFVGDASMPYHNSTDYDGWATNRGGIHSYYETESVNAMGLELVAEVEKAALLLIKQSRVPLHQGTYVERMKALSTMSVNDIPKVEAADHLLSPSHLDGTKRVYAKRPYKEVGATEFHALIVPQLARSAALLAAFWDDIYVSAGQPDLSHYRSYHYPLAPDFVGLDYVGQ